MREAVFAKTIGVATALVALASLALVLLACTPKNEKTAPGDELVRANYLIEQKQTSEAIYILGERLKRDPRDLQARVLLASAYAARGGLELSHYKNFADELLKWNSNDNAWPDDDHGDWLQEIAKASWRIQLVARAFDAIPQPSTPEQAEDLVTGLQILDDGGGVLGGPSLYRALLRTVVFKYQLKANNRLRDVRLCQVEAHELVRWISQVESDLRKIIYDVEAGITDHGAKANLRALADGLSLNLGANFGVGSDSASTSTAGAEKWLQIPNALKKISGACQ